MSEFGGPAVPPTAVRVGRPWNPAAVCERQTQSQPHEKRDAASPLRHPFAALAARRWTVPTRLGRLTAMAGPRKARPRGKPICPIALLDDQATGFLLASFAFFRKLLTRPPRQKLESATDAAPFVERPALAASFALRQFCSRPSTQDAFIPVVTKGWADRNLPEPTGILQPACPEMTIKR